MRTVHFHGHIHPAMLKFTMKNHPSLDWHDAEVGDVKFHVLFDSGIIKISCEVEQFDKALHGYVLYRRALEVSRATADLSGFSLGIELTVIIDKFSEEDRDPVAIEFRNQSLSNICTACPFGTREFDTVYRLLLETPALMFALHDLGLALSRRSHTSASCARAIEALRDYFVSSVDDRKQGWTKLHANLNVSKDYVKFITDHSAGPRHGSLVSISAADSTIIFERTWTIMNRFFEFRKHGNIQLSTIDFPVL